MSSSMTDDNNILEHNFLTSLQHEDQDILDEFLDQRVYDSIGPSTPMPNQVKIEQNELLESFYNSSNQDNTLAIPHSLQLNNNSNLGTPPKNEYLYIDPVQYQNTSSNSVYASPFESKSVSNDSPNTSSNSNFVSSNNASVVMDNGINKKGQSNQLSDYDVVRDELSRLKFGNHNMDPCPKSVDIPDPSYLDFSPEAMSKLPYNLELSNLPNYSRVETQIKLKFSLSPPPPQVLLHIPQDLISKNKFCLNEKIENLSPKLKENLLYLDTYVLTSNFKKSCNICSRCIKREQKRASRRKSGVNCNDSENNGHDTNNYNTPTSTTGVVKNNPNSWADETMMKKAIIFNCKEVVSFPPPNGLNTDLSKSLELSARIICYCRHHKESEGFRLLFIIKNSKDEIVAKQISSTIMIMDRKKNTASSNNKAESSVSNSVAGSSTNLQGMNSQHSQIQSEHDLINSIHPLSPNSIDESASEAQTNTDTNNDGRNLKRKKLSIDDSFYSSTNPMFSSINGFSPMSSDTNTSAPNMVTKSAVHSFGNTLHHQFNLSSFTQPQVSQSTAQDTLPSIQRIIPAQGPIRGGIEITLLGFNFRPGLQVKFGANQALATHCWSETTIVTYLPPAAQPGQVLVSFENHEDMMLGGAQQQQIFTYTDDTDRQLIELALQIVGLKMNGKLEDAKNIAKRIVGSDNNNHGNSNNISSSTTPNSSTKNMNKADIEWFNSAHKAVEQLTKSDLSTEEILINFLSLVDLPNCPIIIPNWQLCNNQGQTLLHLSTLKNYNQMIRFLITHGCKIDVQDNQGLTPLFLASMCGHRDLIKIFIDCKSNWNLKLSNDKHLKDYCDLNVLDIFNYLEENDSEDFRNIVLANSKYEKEDKLTKSISLDSLNSMFTMNYGRHVSKMVIEESVEVSAGNKLESGDRNIIRSEFKPASSSHDDSNYSSEFADSEFESNDEDVEHDDEHDDYEDNDFEDESDYNSEIDSVKNDDGELEDNQSLSSYSTIVPLTNESDDQSSSHARGLWSKVKKVFNNDEEENQLPSYDDLFPFGPSFHSKPKSSIERTLNEQAKEQPVLVGGSSSTSEQQEDAGASSDSSEDMVISYINHPRKTVENDKMLLFFWFPVLVCIIGLFFFVSVMGYNFEFIENIKHFIRTTIGNLMVGNERIGRVFKKNNVRVEKVIHATRRMINE